MAEDTPMPDADAIKENTLMYGHDDDLDDKYPTRPINLHKTLPFHTLFTDLFNPLMETQKKKQSVGARRRVGPHGHANMSPHEAKRNIIERFIANWRKQVGNDFYPAMRLIIPEKDRDRPMYGLKEKAIAKVLIKLTRIGKDSDDAKHMLNWKLPGQLNKASASTAGDFAGRCYEILSTRQLKTVYSDMTIAEVNNALDKLSQVGAEDEQVKIFQRFYRRMNAEEMTWLIRMILRQMKIGATEKTFLDIWHPDAETLFNISSNLRRVCWELFDTKLRLEGEDTGLSLMQCFQPQLAQFQDKVGSFEKLVTRFKGDENDDTFWIEEKLDGERMQLHMMEDPDAPGGKSFGFWSRKAKDYAYLYGRHFDGDEAGALTRFITDAFGENVRNIILDGEMITWDMETDHIVGFGTLKTAALSEKENKTNKNTGQRPLFRVFDCVYLNDKLLTQYTLRDRRRALESAVKGVPRRLEVHPYIEARSHTEIEPALRKVIAESSEGLVLKNPRSMYCLSQRNNDWMKVKPEYMSEFGESLDCVVVGGYFGSGHRGGVHSSFLCALLTDKDAKPGDPKYEHCWSFFKVGGGFSREDYAAIRGRTEGKWHNWDRRRPPLFIELGGHEQNRQHERPDQWIRPSESVVLECKAASVESSDKFRSTLTLRFPRFKLLRVDKRWDQALSVQEFLDVKSRAEKEKSEKEKEFKIEQSRRKKARTAKKPLTVVSDDAIKTPYAGPASKVFEGLAFYIMTEQVYPTKKSKADLEALVKANGGRLVQRDSTAKDLVIVADKRLIKVASLEKRGTNNVVKPAWLQDCIMQNERDAGAPPYLLPFEPNRHMYYLHDDDQMDYEANLDDNGDSYARDIADMEEMRSLLDGMETPKTTFSRDGFLEQLEGHGEDFSQFKTYMFRNVKVKFSAEVGLELRAKLAKNYVRFGGGQIVGDGDEEDVTHVVVADGQTSAAKGKAKVSGLARVVGLGWIEKCWEEGTRVDEERFQWG
ncbi:CDC9 ATP-dependent DNA ligase [Pyrenophora tritici-repentis]|uniref:DNA ligase n=2 Tax=Pyrenophora tritici-repentis TaxID=45151 RepID=A0A2W1FMW5_9PLEO|nr:DNA ligase 4 [Pyrenophora tritici-repentis Pt-1C-BFP]KAA8621632.1 DNA ligase [Pyrenophora tritici-repentis]EDU43033.1 DNA ligase 4 [Pyrenophora tritici-repentis Pt-1C-BFP]KAF7450864.1 DNA ligase [Pyrenophora tritici-repentis]KAF7573519.1 CDC9, ATP-dependent DNA ligase [Pyrenophora tritici-repentis]KAG9380925.1 DNA ligase [Pyrenophora tritici-repentis]